MISYFFFPIIVLCMVIFITIIRKIHLKLINTTPLARRVRELKQNRSINNKLALEYYFKSLFISILKTSTLIISVLIHILTINILRLLYNNPVWLIVDYFMWLICSYLLLYAVKHRKVYK